jgi:hypothetical protein
MGSVSVPRLIRVAGLRSAAGRNKLADESQYPWRQGDEAVSASDWRNNRWRPNGAVIETKCFNFGHESSTESVGGAQKQKGRWVRNWWSSVPINPKLGTDRLVLRVRRRHTVDYHALARCGIIDCEPTRRRSQAGSSGAAPGALVGPVHPKSQSDAFMTASSLPAIG